MLRTICVTLAALLATGSACKKQEDKAPPAAADPKVTSGEQAQPAAADDKGAAETEEKRKQREEIAQDMKKVEDDAATEAKRWDDGMKKKAADLVAKKFKSSKEALQAIIASPHRVPGNSDRDPYRHPVETLTFFGVQPGWTVVEIGTGAGWYTEILAPLLAREGKLIAVGNDPNGPPDSGRTVNGKRTRLFLDKSPEMFGKVELAVIDPPTKLELGPAGSADLVIAMREMHNWQRRGDMDAYLASVHNVLKDGGKFGVEEHRAKAGTKGEDTADTGYVAEDWMIQRVEAAGFKLEAKSEINANPKDTKDYANGVWTLPPTFIDGDKDKDKYKAIGESDRMTLRFVKVPAAAK
jgi:predicted methyltransferase